MNRPSPRPARELDNVVESAELLERSAGVAYSVDDDATAERQWRGALRAWRQARNAPRASQVLSSLFELYQRAGLLHRALDAAFELHDEQRMSDRPEAEVAETLTRIGNLMLLAGRDKDAAHYLG